MPVRSLTQSVLRWPEPPAVLERVRSWAEALAATRPNLQRVEVYGSYGRGSPGVGSELDLLLVEAGASGPQRERLFHLPLEQLNFPSAAMPWCSLLRSMNNCWPPDHGWRRTWGATSAGNGSVRGAGGRVVPHPPS
jgi:hypothetical protein